MTTVPSTSVSLLAFRVRSRTSLELALIGLRHQPIVLRATPLLPSLLKRLFGLGAALPHTSSTPRILVLVKSAMAIEQFSHALAMAINRSEQPQRNAEANGSAR
jgi:hypothetical protein